MWRRLAVSLRRGLFGVGVGVLVWLPVSYFYWALIHSKWPGHDNISLVSGNGYLRAQVSGGAAGINGFEVRVSRRHALAVTEWQDLLLPGRFSDSATIPLYLLTAACLAWPVTSFALARRRQGRGFPVETVEGMKEEG